MALRYLAIFTENKGLRRRLEAWVLERTSLSLVANAASLLFVSEEGGFIPCGKYGGLLGHVFTKADRPVPISSFSDTDCEIIERSAGDHLLKHVWGGYVAILKGKRPGDWSILRDPSGALPCYFIEFESALIVVSEVETAFDAGFISGEINWNFLGTTVLCNGPPARETGLAGVSELLAGWRLSWAGSQVELEPWWSPWDYTDDNMQSVSALTERLRSAVTGCVGAWGTSFDHGLLGVSGGLDSSIVAACLKKANADFTCFTMATNEPFGDERGYARILCEHLDIGLIERQYDVDAVNIRTSTSLHLPCPGIPAFGQSNLATRASIAETGGVDVFFSGIGGDNVFCLTMSATPILDSYLRTGLSGQTWRTVKDICRLTRCSLWDAITAARTRARAGGNAYEWKLDTRLLNADFFRGHKVEMEPGSWLWPPESVLPGKAVHVARVLGLQYPNDLFPRSQAGPQIQPLFSQPVVELCLSVPTWTWCAGGVNRSLARQAFADLLPKSIVDRQSKGGPDSFAYDVALQNLDQIREALLEGVLASHNLLDRPALEVALRDSSRFAKGDHLRFLELTEAEAWVSGWRDRSVSKQSSALSRTSRSS